MSVRKEWILLLFTTVFSFVVICTVGYAISWHDLSDQTNIDYPFRGKRIVAGFWVIHGTSAHLFLFVTSCLSFFFGFLSLLHPRTGVDTLSGTFYYFASHVTLCIFYFCGAIAMLVFLGVHTDEKTPITKAPTAGGAFGFFACLGHAITAYFAHKQT